MSCLVELCTWLCVVLKGSGSLLADSLRGVACRLFCCRSLLTLTVLDQKGLLRSEGRCTVVQLQANCLMACASPMNLISDAVNVLPARIATRCSQHCSLCRCSPCVAWQDPRDLCVCPAVLCCVFYSMIFMEPPPDYETAGEQQVRFADRWSSQLAYGCTLWHFGSSAYSINAAAPHKLLPYTTGIFSGHVSICQRTLYAKQGHFQFCCAVPCCSVLCSDV